MKYFSKAARSEVIPGIHFQADKIPSDVIELSADNAFFNKIPDGMQIDYDPDGVPCGLKELPQKTPEQILNECQLALKDKRSIEARSGVVVNGVEMQTDKESIAAMDQYATESMMNGLTVVHWEKADGTFHDWPIADFKKVFSEITKYVNDCFGRQKVLLADINAAADPTAVDISTGWPSKTIKFV